jgi:predicted RNA polymerase sigma factor
VIDERAQRLDEGALRGLGRDLAALHDDAASTEQTDWPRILAWGGACVSSYRWLWRVC